MNKEKTQTVKEQAIANLNDFRLVLNWIKVPFLLADGTLFGA